MKKVFFSLFLLIIGFSFLPVLAVHAQTTTTGLAQLSQCTGTDCTACNLVYMANGLIKWLIGFCSIIFAILLAIAGVRLVTSGGNSESVKEAKSSFTNALIGFLIIMSAWLIIDTIMRTLVGDSAHKGQLASQVDASGKVTGWLYWSDVQCELQTVADTSNPAFSLSGVAGWTPVGIDGTTQIACGPAGIVNGSPTYDCSGALSQCSSVSGGGYIAGSGDKVICSPTTGETGGGSASGTGPNCPAASASSMVAIPGAGGYTATPDTVNRFVSMRSAAAVAGINLVVTSGYRSEATQEEIWNRNNCNTNNCSGIVGKPCDYGGNGSNHNSGVALDISLSAGSATYNWLKNNGSRFGFYNNLPQDPVHWSPSGR